MNSAGVISPELPVSKFKPSIVRQYDKKGNLRYENALYILHVSTAPQANGKRRYTTVSISPARMTDLLTAAGSEDAAVAALRKSAAAIDRKDGRPFSRQVYETTMAMLRDTTLPQQGGFTGRTRSAVPAPSPGAPSQARGGNLPPRTANQVSQ